MEKFLDDNFDRIDKAGGFVGGLLRKLFGKTSKGFLAIGILSIFGIAVFIYGIFDGFKKDSGK